jgi:hypothetical protein
VPITEVKPEPFEPGKRYFWNKYTSYVDDPMDMVPRTLTEFDSPFKMWIKYTNEANNEAKFAVAGIGFDVKQKMLAKEKERG